MAKAMANREEEVRVLVFDLNKTFYRESSKDEFFEFICTKRPKRVGYIFQMAYYKLLRKLHQIRKTEFKENFFNYLDDIPPAQVEAYATEFWKREFPGNFNKELMNHFNHMKEQGVKLFCATGGLELYVGPLFRLYKIDGFAGTRVDYEGHTYIVQGKACKDEEKVCRLSAHYDGKTYRVIEAYSDSKEAILKEAEKAFLLKDGKVVPYEA